MATKSVKRVSKKATKKVNKAVNKFDFNNSIKTIKKTAVTINDQITDASGEIFEDLMNNGEQFRDIALNTVKETVDTVSGTVNKTIDTVTDKVAETINAENVKKATETVSKATKNVNKYALKTADVLVDEALVTGEKWQGIANKAMKGGLKLAAKQQDIVFDTLDTVKGQFAVSAKRFKKLLRSN